MPRNQLNRRKFLKATGVTTGIGALNIGTVSAKQYRTGLEFAEVSVEVDIIPPDQTSGEYERVTFDPLMLHTVKPEQDILQINGRIASESLVERIANSSSLIYYGGYFESVATLMGMKPTRTLVTDVYPDYRAVNGITLHHEHLLPRAQIRVADDEATISMADTTQPVAVGSENEHELPPQNVAVQVVDPLQHNVDAPHIEEYRRARAVKKRPQQVTAIPKVRVRNHGYLDVEMIG